MTTEAVTDLPLNIYDRLAMITGVDRNIVKKIVHLLGYSGVDSFVDHSIAPVAYIRDFELERLHKGMTAVVHPVPYDDEFRALSIVTEAVAVQQGDAMVEALRFAKQTLDEAEEELRMIRMKDSGAVYNTTLRHLGFGLAAQKIAAALAPKEGAPTEDTRIIKSSGDVFAE